MSSLPNASMPSPVSSSGMKSSAGTAMYPLHRCKTIHLVIHFNFPALHHRFARKKNACFNSQVRHAQGVHNVEGEKDHSAYTSPSFDAPITPLGWRQVSSSPCSFPPARLTPKARQCTALNQLCAFTNTS